MHESHPSHAEHTPDTPTENTRGSYEPDYENLQTLGLKQLALEAAKDQLYGEGTVKDWAIAHIVAPRAYAETATGSTHSSHEQVDRQVALFEDNVAHFTNKLSGTTESHTPTESMPVVPVASDIVSGEPRRVTRGLSDRLRSLTARWRGRERHSGREGDAVTAHQLLGTTAFVSERLRAETDSRLGDYATSWDDVFSRVSTSYHPAIERDIKAAAARQFLESGQIYYSGRGEYTINPLNPPLMDELLTTIRNTVDGSQPNLAEQTSSDTFQNVQRASIRQQEEDERRK